MQQGMLRSSSWFEGTDVCVGLPAMPAAPSRQQPRTMQEAIDRPWTDPRLPWVPAASRHRRKASPRPRSWLGRGSPGSAAGGRRLPHIGIPGRRADWATERPSQHLACSMCAFALYRICVRENPCVSVTYRPAVLSAQRSPLQTRFAARLTNETAEGTTDSASRLMSTSARNCWFHATCATSGP